MHTPPTILTSLALCAALSAAAQATERPADFGRRWVRSHPYTLVGLLQFNNFDPALYRQAGLHTALAWKQDGDLMRAITGADMPWLGHLTARDGPKEGFQNRFAELVESHPGCVGWLINDEPNLTQMGVTARVLAWARNHHPELLVLSNALPTGDKPWRYAGPEQRSDYDYERYVRDYIEIIRPDVMMFDIYPLQDGGGTSNMYWLNLQIVREASLEAGIPYWLFVQSYLHRNRRLPSDSDNRLQLFAPLTFGYTGIAYFTYDGSFTTGFLERGKTKTDVFAHAPAANRELLNVAGPVRFLTSTQVRFIKATDSSPVPQGLLAWDKYTDSEPLFKQITIDAPADASAPPEDAASYLVDAPYVGGLIGYFRDDDGQKYFMLTNTWHSRTATASQRPLTFRLRLDPTVTRVQRLSRLTGKVERIAVDPEAGLVVTLPGGTGDLFKFDTGPFVGLEGN